jgi:DNA-binding NarL/FixJ family response regulator
MNPLETQLNHIIRALHAPIKKSGIESTAAISKLEYLCPNDKNFYLFVSNLDTLTPLFICNRGMSFLNIDKQQLKNAHAGFFLRFLHPDNLMLINKGADNFIKKKDASFKEILKIKSTEGKWHYVYTISRLLHVSPTGTCYIISIAADVEHAIAAGILSTPAKPQSLQEKNRCNEKLNKLSIREKEILYLILDEYNDKEIAERLHISPHTVHSHRKTVMRKLGVKTSIGLARCAFQADMLLAEV